jgi:DNA-binding SARP family transcriptional activator
VSRLRKALGADTIASRKWGYVLRASPSEIDLRRFEGLLAEAEPLAAQERAAKLAEALTLWRGPALADLVSEPALQRDIARLGELRLRTVERRIDAELEAGNADVVGELEELVAKQPLREHLRWLLILALYRNGRQAEALEVYRETRRVLTEELGLEPSPALKELERAILRQDPSLNANAPPIHTEPFADEPDEPGRRRYPPAALLALLALGLAGAATALALVRPEKGTGSVTATEAIFQTLTTTTADTTADQPKTTPKNHPTTRQAHTTPSTKSRPSIQPTTGASSTQPLSTVTQKPLKKKKQVAPPPMRATFTDDFLGSSLNGSEWFTDQQSTGTSQGVQGGGLLLTASNAASSGFHDGILTHCRAQGDFDARVNFKLLNWPAGNNVSFAVNAPNLGNAFVEDAVGGDRYGLFVQPSAFVTIPASVVSGDLRVSRRGNITSAYVRPASATRWQQIAGFHGSTSDTWVGVAIWNISDFGGQPVSVQINSFELHAVGLSC